MNLITITIRIQIINSFKQKKNYQRQISKQFHQPSLIYYTKSNFNKIYNNHEQTQSNQPWNNILYKNGKKSRVYLEIEEISPEWKIIETNCSK